MNRFLKCPVCGEEGEHEVLKTSHDLLVRCQNCGHIHHIPIVGGPRTLSIHTIVSMEAESRVCSIELLSDEESVIGDLVVAECGEDVFGVEVTGIEVGNRRVPKARAPEITTLWTRLIDEVVVKASVHDRRVTLPLYHQVDGEEMFEIGEVRTFGNVSFEITHIKLRNGAFMKKEGWRAAARKIKRLYGNRL